MAFVFTDANFQETVLEHKGVAVVDVWADWCGPCRVVGPVIEELAVEYHDVATIGKLDVDHNPEVAMRYGIRSIPTILFLKDGEVVDKQVGAVSKQALTAKLEQYIK